MCLSPLLMIEIVPAFPSEQFAATSASTDSQIKASKAVIAIEKDCVFLPTLLAEGNTLYEGNTVGLE